MKNGQVDIDHFRTWLVRQVRTSRWFQYGRTPELAAQWGKRLGVAPDILQRAYALKKAEDDKRPFRELTGQRVNEKDNPQLYVHFPEEIWLYWHDECDRLHLKSSALLRGIINTYLLGDWEPLHLSHRWEWKGKICRITRLDRVAYSRKEACLVSRGAKEALQVRSQRQRVTLSALLRGIILEYLEGRIEPVFVDAKRMFEDALRYVEPGD